ncbi:family 20 glycosylhydrolase [uncultured Bacteroides sp.]|uniref:glycoside hydrolase family 20 protein n=1 Tax=uncultured Bacteroides sp. TaxID=162156 RepID=UPI002AA90EA7|nr:family 20 glycosylhydrolase [uncultured Bacteroides sp.]
MKKLFSILLFCSFLTHGNVLKAGNYDLVPLPNSIQKADGHFMLSNECEFIVQSGIDSKCAKVAEDFAKQLGLTSGIDVKVSSTATKKASANAISFIMNKAIPAEGYKLNVKSDRVVIEASAPEGFFHAIQTVKQLLPVAVYGKELAKDQKWELPCVAIEDTPRFKYRGMHLDVSRHFFGVDEVKKYIDVLAVHKLNYMHFHLTDDQGWRIEIKKYPKLTTIGSTRKQTMIKKEWGNFDGKPYGGFYTQAEIKEIVKYAQDRFITIIPEIDLPGHMVAALTAYPELGCTGGPYSVWGEWGVNDDVLCVGKESTFTFLENVLTEVMELFPSKYIHIGGDECPKVRWEKCPTCQAKIKELGLTSDGKHTAEAKLQSYTMSRMEKFLNDKGRKIIGWDEILEGGVAPNATVMSWRGIQGGIEAAQLKHDVIMTPVSHLYFDYYQSLDPNEPFGIGGFTNVEKVYSFEPVPSELTKEQSKYIIGTQANLWTEYVLSNQHLEYMLLPRLAALSEVQWTLPENKNYPDFLTRIGHIANIYDTMRLNYAKHIFGVNGKYAVNTDKGCVEATLDAIGDAPVYYTVDGTEPSVNSSKYTSPVEIGHSCTLKVMVDRSNIKTGNLEQPFAFSKTTAKKVVLNTNPSKNYTFGGASTLVDGIRGGNNYLSGMWIGFLAEPMDVTIDLAESTKLSSVRVGTLAAKGDWIFPPKDIVAYLSADGQDFKEAAKLTIPEAQKGDRNGVTEYTLSFPSSQARFVKVVAHNTNSIPDWHGGKGKAATMFIDEISAE